ncbi:hypothetical protein [Spirilliplanes yamanashiensis]|uniref:Uncharacterized protein n=1 Tax=Spirilliplanes yamanashiensis TaxID=42233 RepID=A0A8J3YBA2_9ACTN|nr:hypothetical protein [Spirilliplanes yamanashiensis]MDP9819087.1 hypothetical protein [Spirilliplanes yamanashiensis]GIJ05541.1 hypothetical protein Sya03_48930 [Spirilliplanes yamanashiensis]
MTDFQLYDTTGDGYGDTLAADTNANGLLDTYAADGNGDSYNETILIDTNENGILDTVQVDTDLNGTVDTTFVDSNENGLLDQANGLQTGNQLVNLPEQSPQAGPLLTGPGVIGGGGHDPLIDVLEHATPLQQEMIYDIFKSRNDMIDTILDTDDDDD